MGTGEPQEIEGIPMILEKLRQANDLHKIPLSEFPTLAEEIRQFLIESVSRTGGHLASNLGAVELTLALHNVLEFPEDKLIWDVGHQAYTHKILTGRKEGFAKLRQDGGLSGFPKRKESDCDAFDTGHSSNSISAGLGYVRARDLQKKSYRVVSVIGDGALTGGMAYEALNNAAELKTNFIIVLNDNSMSISKNVGGISSYLSAIRTAQSYTGLKLNVTNSLKKIPHVGEQLVDAVRKTKTSIKQLIIPGMFFEDMGITYLGPVDGHDIRNLVRGSGENGLEAEAPQQMDALLDALPVHLAECLVQDNHPDGIVLTAVPDAADLGKGGQQRDIERNLGFSSGLF